MVFVFLDCNPHECLERRFWCVCVCEKLAILRRSVFSICSGPHSLSLCVAVFFSSEEVPLSWKETAEFIAKFFFSISDPLPSPWCYKTDNCVGFRTQRTLVCKIKLQYFHERRNYKFAPHTLSLNNENVLGLRFSRAYVRTAYQIGNNICKIKLLQYSQSQRELLFKRDNNQQTLPRFLRQGLCNLGPKIQMENKGGFN